MIEDTAPRAVIYLCCATRPQDHRVLGAQQSECEAIAAREGMTVVRICEDEGASGLSLANRPGLGEARVLIVTRLDRIARSAALGRQIAERIQRAGGRIVMVDGTAAMPATATAASEYLETL